MRTGIISDGSAESIALEHLVNRMKAACFVPLRPLYADMQPYAPPSQIFKAAESRLRILNQRGAERHVIVLDREDNDSCPGELAKSIRAEFAKQGHANVSVVLKDKAFENWLIGDLPAVARAYGKRAKFGDRILGRVESSGADRLNAFTILKDGIEGGYSKRADAIQICKAIDPVEVSRRSRSFKKFMKECGLSDDCKKSA